METLRRELELLRISGAAMVSTHFAQREHLMISTLGPPRGLGESIAKELRDEDEDEEDEVGSQLSSR